MNDREQSLRRALGIPDEAQQVLILEQSAHCDWDWVATFQDYYANGGGGHQPVRTTLQQALGEIAEGSFTYAFCEAAYLKSFMNDPHVSASDKSTLLAAAGSSFLFSSGGITSAENLTPHTESFICNYLIEQPVSESWIAGLSRAAVFVSDGVRRERDERREDDREHILDGADFDTGSDEAEGAACHDEQQPDDGELSLIFGRSHVRIVGIAARRRKDPIRVLTLAMSPAR